MPRLGDVNLIVGRNNTGKTILLEALMLHAARGIAGSLFDVLWPRDEIEPGVDDEPFVRCEALFREAGAGGSMLLEVNSRDPEVNLGVAMTRAPFSASGFNLEVRLGDQIYPLHTPIHREHRRRRELAGSAFVAVGGLDGDQVALWWDALSLTDGEQSLYECLRLLAPIERLSLVQRPNMLGRMAVVKLQGQGKPVPLASLGDGVRRVFQFALALERIQPGDLLLIDEIENGVHYTALGSLWSVLIRAARAKGVQVFATTHSWDCVLGFQQAVAREAASASLIKLYREGEDIQASTFDEQELAVVAREEIEVR